MAKKLTVSLLFLLLLTLCFLLPPHVFSLADKALLENPSWEPDAGIALNRAPLSPAEKIAVLASGQSGLTNYKIEENEEALYSVLEEVSKLSYLGLFPYPPSRPLAYNVETTLYVGGDNPVKMDSYYLEYESCRLSVVYGTEDQKIYGFAYGFYDEAAFKTYIDTRDTNGPRDANMESFAGYLGIELDEPQEQSNYFPLKDQAGGFFCSFQPQLFYAEAALVVAAVSPATYADMAQKSLSSDASPRPLEETIG